MGGTEFRQRRVARDRPAARKAITDRYRKDWAELGRKASDIPMMGITRHIVVAPTDAEAKAMARRAYAIWRDAIEMLWKRSGVPFVLTPVYPTTYDELEAIGHGIAGSPSTVRDYVARLHEESGVNYVLAQMMFGDLSYEEASTSVQLFARDVMPAFAGKVAGIITMSIHPAASHALPDEMGAAAAIDGQNICPHLSRQIVRCCLCAIPA